MNSLVIWSAMSLLGNLIYSSHKPIAGIHDIAEELPRNWKMDDIEKVALNGKPGHVHVLAWQTIEDQRPLRVESCLVLVKSKKDTGIELWQLQHYYRTPSSKNSKWIMHSRHVMNKLGLGDWKLGTTDFSVQPKNRQIYESLREVGWEFDLEMGWRFVNCGVCEKNWVVAVGERPTRFFGK